MPNENLVVEKTKVKSENMQRKIEHAEEVRIIQLIVFHLGDEEFCADINQLREIIRIGLITPIPDSPDFIKGVTNVRGEITVVIDLRARFSLRIKEDVESKHIIITKQEKNLFGLLVDEVAEVLRIPITEIKPTPELVTRIDRVYISGVITIQNRLIILLDLNKVLLEEELARLSEVQLGHNAVEAQRPDSEEESPEIEEKSAEKITQKKATGTKNKKTRKRAKKT